MTDSNPLRERILKTLGQQGALSLRGLTTVLRPQDPKTIEQEVKTMARRKLLSEPFDGSYELTEKGRKEYEALTPHAQVPPHGRFGPTGLGGIPIYDRPPLEFEETDEDDEEKEEICEGCDEYVEDCTCDEEEDDEDRYDY